jgi:hypothetical protein
MAGSNNMLGKDSLRIEESEPYAKKRSDFRRFPLLQNVSVYFLFPDKLNDRSPIRIIP